MTIAVSENTGSRTGEMMNSAFYEFHTFTDEQVQGLRQYLLDLGHHLKLKGKIVLANEGINGSVSGPQKNVMEFRKELLLAYPVFEQMLFKDNMTDMFDHKRMIVKIKPEIITIKEDLDMELTAPYIEPEELHSLFKQEDSNIILLDIRNNYEYDYGHFEKSLKIDTTVFSEFNEHVDWIKSQVEGKKVITYCTGGVRCEKATVLLKEAGINDMYQLKGGILNYGARVGTEYWNGKCFVFDKRKLVDIDPKIQEIEKKHCEICNLASDDHITCNQCSKNALLCSNCVSRLENTCSTLCHQSIGVKINYL